MRLLLTNDDGIAAPGLAQLHRLASRWGDPIVVAPKQPWSGCGHRICTDRDIEIVEIRPGWWSVDAFPADCVRIALSCLVDSVDWVLAGINDGANLGSDVYMSGTVAAAREAALFRKPAVAISQYRSRASTLSWDSTRSLAEFALSQVLERPLEAGSLWNINLPDRTDIDPGFNSADTLIDCAIDSHPLPTHYERDPAGKTVRYAGRYQERRHDESTDVHRCFQGAITVSRLTVCHS